MGTFFNAKGRATVQGTTGKDVFWAFMADTNFGMSSPDELLATLVWTTPYHLSDGSLFTIRATNIQVSHDVLLAAEGTDTIYCSAFNDALFYNNGVFMNGLGGFSGVEQIYLGAGDDVIDLSPQGPDGVDYAKDVKIFGEEGNDIIVSGAGNDTLDGGAGDDVIIGGKRADTIYGAGGNDILYGDDLGFDGLAGDDTLYGQGGHDTLYGGGKADRLDGGEGNDFLYGEAGNDTLLGGIGDDVLVGDLDGIAGNDSLDGGSGNDQLFGGGGADTLKGGAGNDWIEGGDGDDVADGGGEDDTFIAGGGSDTFDGGLGIDTIRFSGNRADYSFSVNAGVYTFVDLRSGSPDGSDKIKNAEFFQFADGVFPSGQINESPVIKSDGGNDNAWLSKAEGTLVVTTVVASDTDAGQVLTYGIVGGTDRDRFTIDAATGVLTFVALPDFENPEDADHDNVYEVVVGVSDGYGGLDTQALTVTVSDVLDGAPPRFTSGGGAPIFDLTLLENNTAVALLTAADPDGTIPTLNISGGPDADRFALDASTGELRFVNAPDFEQPNDANGDGIYEVRVTASDGQNTASQVVRVLISNENEHAPVITSNGGAAAAGIVMNEGATFVTTVVATDADRLTPTFLIAGGDDALCFSIDHASGALSFVAAPNFEALTDANGDGRYVVVVRATDGLLIDEQTITVTIVDINDEAPIIFSNGGGSIASVNVAENSLAVTIVQASDLDGPTVSYLIDDSADAGFFVIDNVTGALSFKVAPDFEDQVDANGDGIYQVNVRATDGTNSAAQLISVRVTDVNEVGRTLTGTAAGDVFSTTASSQAFRTTGLSDIVYGLDGNDRIDGGAGTDRMEGGLGDDTYFVGTFSDDGKDINDDLVIEKPGEGYDLVNASVSYRLATNVERLTLLGTAGLSGIGNELANLITGNSGANYIAGLDGNDTLVGGEGDDVLDGGNGNDSLIGGLGLDDLRGGQGSDQLDGGGGPDVMQGGEDSDTYTVDAYSDDGDAFNDDRVIELVDGGTADLVKTSVTYTLAENVENLTLIGNETINGRGNGLNNVINGNNSANQIFGEAGNDTIDAGGGDDIVYGGLGSDTLNGKGGNDRLYGEESPDKLTGGAGDDWLHGGSSNDTLIGSEGADYLIGGLNKDVLTGGLDRDIFFFGAFDSSLQSALSDTITDFSASEDIIDLEMVLSPLNPSSYTEAMTGSPLMSAALGVAASAQTPGVSVVFVAGPTDGWLFWDSNGDGNLDQGAILLGVNTLSGFDYVNVI